MKPTFSNYMKSAGKDFPASIVVFLVALPLCLGIALGSNAPLFSGLIAGIVGGIVIGALSGSQLSVSGPAAGLTAIVIAALVALPSFEAFLLSVLIAGVLQVILGYIRAGVIADYVPSCVIKGMLAAIGIILILKQLPHLVGYDAVYEGNESFQEGNSNTFSSIGRAFERITPAAIIIGLLSIALFLVWEKFTKGRKGIFSYLPAPLLVVLFAVGLNAFFKTSGDTYAIDPEHMVNLPIPQTAGEFFSFFGNSPDFSMISNPQVWITAVTLALVASLETLLSIEAVDDLDPYQRVTNKDRELKAQGVGNLISGLLGGLPITAVIVRSSANVNAGARTKMSAIYHGLLLLLCVAFIPGILNLIPKAALAAILILTGYKLAKPMLFSTYYKKGWDQFVPFVVTIGAILLTDLLIGVAIGIVVGLFFVLRSNFRSSVFVVNNDNQYLFRLRKDVSFLNKPIIKNRLEKVPEGATVLIDMTRADFIDQDVVEVVDDFLIHAPLKGIYVEVRRNKLQREKGQRIQEEADAIEAPAAPVAS